MSQAEFDPEQFYLASCLTYVNVADGVENRNEVQPGETVIIRARVVNDTDYDASATVEYYLNGEVQSTGNAFVRANSEETNITNFTPEDIGVTEGEVDIHLTLADIHRT